MDFELRTGSHFMQYLDGLKTICINSNDIACFGVLATQLLGLDFPGAVIQKIAR